MRRHAFIVHWPGTNHANRAENVPRLQEALHSAGIDEVEVVKTFKPPDRAKTEDIIRPLADDFPLAGSMPESLRAATSPAARRQTLTDQSVGRCLLHLHALQKAAALDPGAACVIVEDDAVLADGPGLREALDTCGPREVRLLAHPGEAGPLSNVGSVVASCCAYGLTAETAGGLAQNFLPLYGDVPLQLMALRYSDLMVHKLVFHDMSKRSWDSSVTVNNGWTFHPSYASVGERMREGDREGALRVLEDAWGATDAAMYHHLKAIVLWGFDVPAAAQAFALALKKYRANGIMLDGSRSVFLNEYMNFCMTHGVE